MTTSAGGESAGLDDCREWRREPEVGRLPAADGASAHPDGRGVRELPGGSRPAETAADVGDVVDHLGVNKLDAEARELFGGACVGDVVVPQVQPLEVGGVLGHRCSHRGRAVEAVPDVGVAEDGVAEDQRRGQRPVLHLLHAQARASRIILRGGATV